MKLFAFSVRPYDELPYFLKLEEALGFEFAYTTEYPTLENLSKCKGYDCVSIITNPTDAAMLDKYRELGIRCISTRSIGYDHIDYLYAKQIGIKVAHVTYQPESVADYSIMLMLMLCRKAKKVLTGAMRADYDLEGKIGKDLRDQVVGIVGTGRIGATVAKHLQGFGCRIIASDVYRNPSLEGIVDYCDTETLFRTADIISLHIPGLPENYHMINKHTISTMKDGVMIVNAARGTLIDTDDLIEAVRSGKVAGAALDTFEHEIGMCYVDLSGQRLDKPDFYALNAEENIILSPHMAFYSENDVFDMVRNSVLGLQAMYNGESTPFEV